MGKFNAKIINGGINFLSDLNRDKFKNFIKKNEGMRLEISPLMPESKKQRGFYHGAVLKLWAYLDGKDYMDSLVIKQIHEIAKLEFNAEIFILNKKEYRVGKTTKQELNDGFLEKVIDYIGENYGVDTSKVLDPKLYKKFRDTIYSFTNKYDSFIDYMVALNMLPIVDRM